MMKTTMTMKISTVFQMWMSVWVQIEADVHSSVSTQSGPTSATAIEITNFSPIDRHAEVEYFLQSSI